MVTTKSRKAVTLADVAKAAGISKTTASHALSGKGWVSPSTRETVLRLAQEMEFEADPLARLLSHGRCEKTIGFLTLDLDLSGRTRQLQLIQGKLCDLGYSVPIYAYGYRGNDVPATQMELLHSMLAQRPRAVVCNTTGVLPEVFERLQRFAEEGGTLVCYGYSQSVDFPCDQVVHTQGEGYYLATKHLIDLGHRHIGLFSVGHRKPSGAMLTSFARAMAEVNAEVRDEWLFTNDGTERYECDGARIAREFLAMKERPTAMIVANDYAAVAFLAEVTRAGVHVPSELSVVGHDDDAIAPYGVVPLTTISEPVEKAAQCVVDLLLHRLSNNGTDQPRIINIDAQLVVRQSTGPV